MWCSGESDPHGNSGLKAEHHIFFCATFHLKYARAHFKWNPFSPAVPRGAPLARPVPTVDEAQEMLSTVLSELRLLCSTRLDSHILLTVVLAGDGRLLERLRSDEFLPLASRMRVRLAIERATPDELQEYLRQALHKARAVNLMTPELITTAGRSRPAPPGRPHKPGRRAARV